MIGLIPPERPVFKVVSRAEWAGDDCPVNGKYAKHKPVRLAVHHSFIPNSAQYKGIESIRGIYRYHVETKKYSDIGYHYLISPDGSMIFEGRPMTAQGAHCGGDLPKGVSRIFGNIGTGGICLLGDYDAEPVNPGGLRTLAVLIADLCEKWAIKLDQIYGHCQAWSRAPKTCPGKNLFTALFGAEKWKQIKF